MRLRIVTVGALGLLAGVPMAQAAPSYLQNPAVGYWFYQNKPPKPETILTIPPKNPSKPQKSSKPSKLKKKIPPCTTSATWTAKCGFVTPKSFSMQAKERHYLIRYMVMHPGAPKAVLNVQKYTKWVVNQALYAGNVWRYNMVNHPSLFPKATSPISEYGLDIAMKWQHFNHEAAWQAIRKFHGQLIVFTKANCDFCHAQTLPLMWFQKFTGMKVIDASLEGPCSGWFKGRCVPPSESTIPAEILHVKIVPSVYLHLPGKVWIRVSAGLTTGQTLESRLYNFFLSWRLGVEKHLKTYFHGLPMDLNPTQQPATSQQVLHVLFGPEQAHTAQGALATEEKQSQ